MIAIVNIFYIIWHKDKWTDIIYDYFSAASGKKIKGMG